MPPHSQAVNPLKHLLSHSFDNNSSAGIGGMSGGPSSSSNTMVGGGVGLGGNVGQGASAYSFYNQSKTS
jgi:hypothetical protein